MANKNEKKKIKKITDRESFASITTTTTSKRFET